jgi:hypothetical protein
MVILLADALALGPFGVQLAFDPLQLSLLDLPLGAHRDHQRAQGVEVIGQPIGDT